MAQEPWGPQRRPRGPALRYRTLCIGLTSILAVLGGSLPTTAVASPPPAPGGGLVLDGWGGLHPFGGATVNTSGSPYWQGWDIARSIAVREDGSGGWTLDGYGYVHNWGLAAAVNPSGVWPGFDIVRDFVITSHDANGTLDGRQGYVLDGYGGIHPWGGAPTLSGYPYQPIDQARSLAVHRATDGTPDGGWTLFKDGSIHPFGAAGAAPVTLPQDNVFQKLRPLGTGGYTVAKWGVVATWGTGVSPYWTGYSDWKTWDIVRDVYLLRSDNATAQPQPSSADATAIYQATLKPHGGTVLDAYGGLHPLGGMAINSAGAPYWSGWDIARSAVLRTDGSGGWTLDGFGGIHNWGVAPRVDSPVYWSGWDIARAMAVSSRDGSGIADGRTGYVLDGFGGLHPWGGAGDIGSPPYLAGFDLYRGLAIHFNTTGAADGGWAMDVAGRTYAFGAAPALGNVSPDAMRPIFHSFHSTQFGYYSVASDGVIAAAPAGGQVTPYWDGWTDWGNWDIIRDVALINPVNPDATKQPLSSGARDGYAGHVYGHYLMAAPMVRQAHSLSCEAASMQIALAARGVNVSQDWELSFWGADLRHSARDAAGNIIQWGDPYTTFVGNVNASEWNATGYGVYYPPLVSLTNALGHNAIGKQGWDVSDLLVLVAAGYPAAIEISYDMQPAGVRSWTAWDGRSVPYILNDHVVTLVGVDFGGRYIIVNDPNTGTVKYFSFTDFQRSFSYLGNMATVIS